jgi:serine/threonine protein kinase
MAPEQCEGSEVDARTDLYAMGLVLYELCAGRGPFDELRGNDHALRFAHCARRPPPPSAFSPRPLPPGLDALIVRALAKAPADRFQSAAEMAAALRALGEPRRRRGEIPAIVSALAVACFALGLALGRALPFPEAPAAAIGEGADFPL